MRFSYIKNGETLRLDPEACTGCGACLDVCPHAVFVMESGKARIMRREGCMECGACALNCPVHALQVSTGVGCAAAILSGKLRGGKVVCCGEDCCR